MSIIASSIHVVIGTPMFAGQCHDTFARSVNQLRAALKLQGIKCAGIYVGNEALIGRARDMVTWHFLNQKSTTHLCFIDGDIGFRTEDIVRMLNEDLPVLIAPVPLKTIDYEQLVRAVNAGIPTEELHKFTGVFNLQYLENVPITLDRPFRIRRGGGAVMMIKRDVFAKLDAELYIANNPGASLPPGAEVYHYFPTYVHDRGLLSEDYGFCQLCEDAGVPIWAAPWVEVTHSGTHQFSGSFQCKARLPDA